MKHYFKYDSGFVNIDDENLFLTNSGNWQETWDMKEKNAASVAANNFRITKMKGFVYTVFGGAAAYIILMVNSGKMISISILAGLAALSYFVFNYFKSDFGKRYKIPLAKIDRIEKQEKGLKINFRNANNEPDTEVINNVDPAGVGLLVTLALLKYDSGIA
jgi:hypothetical protein